MPGGILITMASVRVTAAGTPKPIFATRVLTGSLSVTANENNAATIYVVAGSGTAAAAKVATTKLAIALTPKQSFTFTGIPMGTGGFRDLSVGTVRLYVDAMKDNDRAIITYYKWEP